MAKASDLRPLTSSMRPSSFFRVTHVRSLKKIMPPPTFGQKIAHARLSEESSTRFYVCTPTFFVQLGRWPEILRGLSLQS